MSLRIVGAGLGRTGTLTLKTALEQLGLGPCYHMREVIDDPSRAPLWVEAAKGRADWERIFAGYSATVDYPGCTFWRELADLYPEAKVLLSVRDPDRWFESTQATIFSDAWNQKCMNSPMAQFFELTVYRDFGDRIHDRVFMTDYFRRHVADVERTIPKERLLVYEAREGWDPLCAFLDIPVPDEPFPHVNSREEMLAGHPDGPPVGRTAHSA